ncbi:uncharacterized protein LOC119936076 [Tachyglossus aculeatus]|uniref:uncharacterized protein LOC119936076 n=1 Tax=Tachyglossus aculeatus TaxID=9261 RepID=UPI0018F6A53E|nr:uncharacterized protein LOC119936076 [Tachyglossus aculeatus]
MDSSGCPRLLALLQLVGEALLLAHVPAAAPSRPAEASTITSRAGETVRLHCRPHPAGQPIRRVSWTLLQDGPHATVHSYSNGTDQLEDQDARFARRTGLSVRPGEAVLTLRDVRPRDSGTYRCHLGDGRAAVPRDVFLHVMAPGGPGLEEGGVEARQPRARGGDDVPEEPVQLGIVADGLLQVRRGDALPAVGPGGVTGQLQELGRQVLQHGGQEDRGARGHPLGVVAAAQEAVHQAHREPQPGPGGARAARARAARAGAGALRRGHAVGHDDAPPRPWRPQPFIILRPGGPIDRSKADGAFCRPVLAGGEVIKEPRASGRALSLGSVSAESSGWTQSLSFITLVSGIG